MISFFHFAVECGIQKNVLKCRNGFETLYFPYVAKFPNIDEGIIYSIFLLLGIFAYLLMD